VTSLFFQKKQGYHNEIYRAIVTVIYREFVTVIYREFVTVIYREFVTVIYREFVTIAEFSQRNNRDFVTKN
jgi:hypothetical protein